MQEGKLIDFHRLGELARDAQGGNAEAYETFLEALYPYVAGIVRSRVGDWVDVEDITQECLLGMHKSMATWHSSKSIKPWIHAIIRYKLVDYFRAHARKREAVTSPEILERTHAGSVNSQENTGTPEINISHLLQRLPEPLQRAVVLTKMEGLSTQEAAKREGIKDAALRKRISRAYRLMGKLVEQDMRHNE